jgi:hypothetical protein
MVVHSTTSILKFTHRTPQSPAAICPGQISAGRSFAEQLSRAGQSQNIQNLLLDRIQLGELRAEQDAIRSSDKNNTVVGKGLQDAWDRWPEIVSAFRHQATDRFMSLGQYPADLAFHQARHQAANRDQQDQTDNPLLSSPVRLCQYCSIGACGASLSSQTS